MTKDLAGLLADPWRYERQVDRLYRRRLLGRGGGDLNQEGVGLSTVSLHRTSFARKLARTVRRGEYRFAPGRVHTIRTEGKPREIYTFCLTDLILHGVVADIISESVSPLLSPSLYSYRPGLSWWRAVALFASYVRRHRRQIPDPSGRGLYVIRRDVDSYTDSIPVHPRSRVWAQLRDALSPHGRPRKRATEIPDWAWAVVENVVRPEFITHDGGLAGLVRGVPTGQPISCVLFNLYLNELDRDLDRIPGGFYARYSDDLLFAHPDPEAAGEASRTVDRVLSGLELNVKPDKSLDLYLTGAGRRSKDWPEARGTTRVPFLGTFIQPEGTVSLDGQKLRELLREIRVRARRTSRAQWERGVGREEAGRAVCAALNSAFEEEGSFFRQKSSGLLLRAVTHRPQLAQIDHLAARAVLKAVTGKESVRAFRLVPYRKIREEWGLKSLLHARNKWPGEAG